MAILIKACLILYCFSITSHLISQCDGIILNEIHYDNSGGDVGEFIEVAIPTGTNLTLSEYSIDLYNGSNGESYNDETLDNFTLGTSDSFYDYYYWETAGIQNGSPDGFGLSKNGIHCELLSYEGVFIASAGTPADGQTSVDILVSESNTTAIGESLQLVSGNWNGPLPETKGSTNGSPLPSISVIDAIIEEGHVGTQLLSFIVELSETDNSDVNYVINTANGSATTADNDYIAIISEMGTIPAGQLSNTIEVSIIGDTTIESNENFNITISHVSANATVLDSIALGTIVNDDYQTCPNPGDIIITEIMNNPSSVSDSNGEFIELFNSTDFEIDIEGYLLEDNGTDSHIITNGSPLIISPSSYLTLGNNADTTTNGGVFIDYSYSGISLNNSEDEVILTCAIEGASVEIDRVEYDNGMSFPDPNGASMNLNPNNLDGSENDNGLNWCESTSVFGAGDYGTPGQNNDPCNTILPSITINDLAINEGNSGSSNFTFTITLSSPSPTDVFFEINTTDGTATSIDNDYQPLTMSLDTIIAGTMSNTINVLVYGDTIQEPDEYFNVILSNISSNVIIADSIGIGTIVSEENNCPNMWNLTGTISGVVDYETSGSIISNQLIKNTAVVDYDANISIDLNPGFEIELGASFEAFIDGCNNGEGGGIN